MKSQVYGTQAKDNFKKKYDLVDETSEILSTKMERFEFIVDKLNADEFLSMETFWESISKNNSK